MRLYTLSNGLFVLAEIVGQYCGSDLYRPIVTGSKPYVMAYILRHNLTVTEE